MPQVKRGFVFRYFDKFVCAVVAVLLLIALAYAMKRRAGLSGVVDVEKAKRDVTQIETKLDSTPPAAEPVQWSDRVKDSLYSEREPRALPGVFYWEFPVEYSPLKVGPSLDVVLEFDAPLATGSIVLEGTESLIGEVVHPVDDDYSKVLVRTKQWEGGVTVVGRSGERDHRYPIIISSEAGKTAYPPTEVAVVDRVGRVRLEFQPDPRITEEEVEVAAYEVWRRDLSDPLGEFVKVGSVGKAGEAEQRGITPTGTITPGGVEVAPGVSLEDIQNMDPMELMLLMSGGGAGAAGTAGRRGAATETGEQEGAEKVTYTDRSARPGVRYSYKVCMRGANTFPATGEFTDVVEVRVNPRYDFRFRLGSEDRVRFEVVKAARDESTRAPLESFWVGLGDEIGGVTTNAVTGSVESFLTGALLVDYHSRISKPGSRVPSSRVIYADKTGCLRELWRNEVRAETLWDQARRRPRAAR